MSSTEIVKGWQQPYQQEIQKQKRKRRGVPFLCHTPVKTDVPANAVWKRNRLSINKTKQNKPPPDKKEVTKQNKKTAAKLFANGFCFLFSLEGSINNDIGESPSSGRNRKQISLQRHVDCRNSMDLYGYIYKKKEEKKNNSGELDMKHATDQTPIDRAS